MFCSCILCIYIYIYWNGVRVCGNKQDQYATKETKRKKGMKENRISCWTDYAEMSEIKLRAEIDHVVQKFHELVTHCSALLRN